MPGTTKPNRQSKPPDQSPAQKTDPAENHPLFPRNCPVVAFGASAGGLEAFREVLENIPPNAGLAYIFIQHLDPKHTSILTDLLSKSTNMPVIEVRDRMPVKPDRVYVIPPNASMRLEQGRLRLKRRLPAGPHMPADEFFRSLASEEGNRAIAVILSGTATDGTLGLKAVKAAGGITFAQDQTAKFDGMPRNAVASGCVDLVLSPDRIAQEILRLCHHPYLTPEEKSEEDPETKTDWGQFNDILTLLRSATGVDFALYKRGTLRRRILRRAALHKAPSEGEYLKLLKEDSAELKALFHDILIGVTGFFRENDTFEGMEKRVFPAILADRHPEKTIRIWIPGCATGEDVYSVVISLMDYMREKNLEIPLQVFGTDLSEPSLMRARAGAYPESIAADVSPERLRRYFVKVDGQYQINRTVRDQCIFAQQNVTKDAPFFKLDLIVCRNVLIYLGPVLQGRVMRFFHYALNPTGFLCLGLSESVGPSTELFTLLEKRLRIYARKGGASLVPQLDFAAYGEAVPAGAPPKVRAASTTVDAQRRVDQYILSRYSPAGVLVDEDLNVIQFHGHTSPYLEHAAGEPALNMNRMLRGELLIEFRRLFDRARKKHTAAKGEPVAISHLDRVHNVRVSVTPMVLPGSTETQYLTLFEEFPVPAETKRQQRPAGTDGKAGGLANRIHHLESELSSTKQYLESVIEEQQATTEELKSANEEVQSSNEELQSTNEELLTSKEELQSANEELTTLNEELHNRNTELAQTNNDLNNLLSSVNIPIVMLGNDLRIRRFTPQAEKVLNLLPADIGRPISDFKPKIDIPDLEQWFADVIENLRVKEHEVQGRDGRWHSLWIRPYRTAENKIDGAVMALLDITDRKVAAEARYRRLFEAAKDAIIITNAETGEIIDLNPYASKTLGIPRTASIGLKYWNLDLFRSSDLDAESLKELHDDETIQKDMTITTKAGKRIEIEVIGNVYLEAGRKVIQFNIRDISERKTLEENARRTLEQVQQAQKLEAIGRLAGGVAHDFNNLLTAVAGHADLLKQRLGPENPAYGDAEQIGRAAERAGRLTRQLLAFGRRQQFEPEVLNLNNLILEMEQMVRVTLPASIDLRLDCAPDLKAAKVDRGQFEQVILNLAMNARDAMPSGGVLTMATRNARIDAEYSREHPAVPPGEYVRLEVSDTGAGMDPETKAHLFEPYFTTKPRGKGAGLGLSMIYGAVRNAGGHIWAVSELGRGSAFCIFLPQVNGAVRATQKKEEAHGLQRGGETILLVEDEEMVRTLTARVLQQCGYEVLEAPGGQEAMRIAREFKGTIHLLLTDVVMPHMNGRELASGIAAMLPETKIMFMSGHTEDAIIQHGVSGRECAFLQKPFTPETLSREIREILES